MNDIVSTMSDTIEHHRDVLQRALRDLQLKRPRVAFEIKRSVDRAIANGADVEATLIQARLQCQEELYASDGTIFGRVYEDGDEPPAPKHAGGRPPKVPNEESLAFLRFKEAHPRDTAKKAARAYKAQRPWLTATEDDLVSVYKYRKVRQF